MNTVMPSTANLYLVVGFDGSAPATRALEAAVGLLRGRTGSIDVVYVAHLTTAEMMSADAVAQVEVSFEEIAQQLKDQVGEQLRGREDRWEFQHGQGMITDVLIQAAERLRDAHPADNVVIMVGSSSQAMHRIVGSVAVSLARHAPVPLVIVP